MANSDLILFLQDALTRFDPDLDLSEGSRADTEIIQPIVQRIGTTPFDEDIATFVRERVRQAFPELAITELDPLTDTVIDPMRVLVEPLVREVKLTKLRGSLRNIESLSDDEVDALMSNFFEARRAGGLAIGVVRFFFATPQSVSLTLTNPATTGGGLRFFPTRPQAITADQMLLNVEGSEYYFDVNYTAEFRGDEYNIEPGEIKSVANLPTATRVRNIRRFRNGAPREGSLDFAARTQEAQSDKTLTVERGIIRTLSESFPVIRRIFSVGFRDPEMERDVVRGGSLGSIPEDDTLGQFFGTGTAEDDLDADTTTPLLEAPTGFFVDRLGAVGTSPSGWYVTIVYTDGSLVVEDVEVLEVVSATRLRVNKEMPVTSPATPVTWALRQRKLTITDIPGGIVLPDTADGTLEIEDDQVHIGGKVDIYIAGETESATAQITRLTDQMPLARGDDAETQASTPGSEDIVLLNDLVVGGIEAGMSLVLEEGVDAGSYRILEVLGASVRLDTDMTGTQAFLAWKVVNDIDVELTDPKDIKVEGGDMVTAAGSTTVTTSGATNFLDANVQEGDVLELFDPIFGGEFQIEEVNAVNLVVTPSVSRTSGGVAYRIFRRSEAVDPPLLRVSSLELLDSGGAPSGTTIPYRDPVLVLSKAFQNEGSGFVFEGRVIAGLVTDPIPAIGADVGGATIEWAVYNREQVWAGPINTSTFTFSAGFKTASQIVAEINADALLDLIGVKAVVLTLAGNSYVGFVCESLLRFEGGTALSTLGWDVGESNAHIRGFPGTAQVSDFGVRVGDLVEFVDGNNAGSLSRVLVGPIVGVNRDKTIQGTGPLGPESTSGISNLYDNAAFRPDVGVLCRIGRPSVGSARTYFLNPTSAEFHYRDTRASVELDGQELVFRPDPENVRIVQPAPPNTELPSTGETQSPSSMVDTSVNFLVQGIRPGDLLDVLYTPILSTAPLPTPADIVFTGANTLRLRLGNDPFITISFPFDMPRQDAIDYINEQVGEDIASLTGVGLLSLISSRRIEIDGTSTALVPLNLSAFRLNSDHPDQGTFIVTGVAETALSLSSLTQATLLSPSEPGTVYRIRRYVQRISSTEMNDNQDASGLYYADVQMIALGPGDRHNIDANVQLAMTGHRADGYRLRTDNPVTSFSRAEVLWAEISRTILLVGSSDSPEEYVQLSQQNVQVSYDRSQLVDEVQSFVDSDLQRVLCEEMLVKHLLPHYIRLSWNYVGGSSEPDIVRALESKLDEVEPNEQLEVTDLTDVLRRRGATSVYTADAGSPTGRGPALFVVVAHDTQRRIQGQVVRDFVETVRTQRYIPDVLTLRRVSTSGIR